jgi:hypothetical protein
MYTHRLLIIITLLLIPHLSLSQTARELLSPNEESGGHFGYSVSDAGDVDNDGYKDIIIGAKGEMPYNQTSGMAYVFSGADERIILSLDSPWTEWYPSPHWFGYSVSGVGDVNNDGFDDVIIGARMESGEGPIEHSGRAYVFSGARGGLLYSLVSPNEEQYGHFGYSVSGAGDVNGDGYADFMVGAPLENNENIIGNGYAYVFSGLDGSLLYSLSVPGQDPVEGFGVTLAAIGDINGDGCDDIAVDTGSSITPIGQLKAYVFSGYDGSTMYTLEHPESTGHYWNGSNISTLNDIDNDGVNEIVLGAIGSSDIGGGRVLVFSGATGSLIKTIFPPTVVVSFGYSVSGTGDIDGDGYSDIAVGSPYVDLGVSMVNAGRIYLYNGQDGALINALVSPNPEEGGLFGHAVSGAIDMDGNPAVLVGAYFEDPGPSPRNAGRAYIFENPLSSGVPTPNVRFVLDGPYPNPVSGNSRLELRTRSELSVGATLRLFDIFGRQVTEPIHPRIHSNGIIVFQPGDLDLIPGIYQWQLENGTSSAHATMVIVP